VSLPPNAAARADYQWKPAATLSSDEAARQSAKSKTFMGSPFCAQYWEPSPYRSAYPVRGVVFRVAMGKPHHLCLAAPAWTRPSPDAFGPEPGHN